MVQSRAGGFRMRKSLSLRLFSTFLVLLFAYGAGSFAANRMLIDSYRDRQFLALIGEMERWGTLANCDADPKSWSMPDLGLGGVMALSPDGVPLFEPSLGKFEVPVEEFRVVPADVPRWAWSGTIHTERVGECRDFLVYQQEWMGFPAGQLAWVTSYRMILAAVMAVAAWMFVAAPVLRRLEGLAAEMHAVELAGFRGALKVPPETEIAKVATAFNRAAQTAVSSMDALIQADRSIREIVANVNHDVRTPIAALKLSAGKLMRLAPEAIKDTTLLADINYLDGLVGNLALLVQLKGNPIPPPRRVFDLRELVDRAVARLSLLGEVRSVSVQGGTPDDPVWVNAEEIGLEQALSNLVHNAIDFAQGQVAVSCQVRTDGVWLEVADDGPGAPAIEIATLSERHVQGSGSRTRGRSGQGLGLSIARAVAENHGGTLTLEKIPDGGMLARIHLPASVRATPT